MFSRSLVLLSVVSQILAQELAPTEVTSFKYPNNGANMTLPFPSSLAKLTGLTDWPDPQDVAPFTPNMRKLYDPSSTRILPDIVAPPNSFFPGNFHDPVRSTPSLNLALI